MGGGSSSYLKIKVNKHVASFVYYHKPIGSYVQQTFSCHPDNKFRSIKYQNLTYYQNYSGNYYYFDGDWTRLHDILDNFDPTKLDVTYLINRLEVECDLETYKTFWTTMKEWILYIASIAVKVITAPASLLSQGAHKLLGWYTTSEK